ncbi:hypothetical protein [Methanoregula sp.]|uniref:hypothetical protein n=1 Tax=Methanoregula sp. TaxID=2052170 RepID=UPI003563ABDC
MDLSDEIKTEMKRTEEEIHKTEIRKEIDELNGGIKRPGPEVSREVQKPSPAPSATANNE